MAGEKEKEFCTPGSHPTVAIYLITYRRHELLKRSLESLRAQRFTNFVVRVVNDDPSDSEVELIVSKINDMRFSIYRPMGKRGPTKNFNLMFSEAEASFVSLLEDDNWWEPNFLTDMVSLLSENSGHHIAVANERIWTEQENGSWVDTGRNIWSFDDIRRHALNLLEISGSARCCNSSMLIRLPEGRAYATPDDIPVDVTEHFRDRTLSGPLLLNGAVLVNYAETLNTARITKGEEWGVFQALLMGSIFEAAKNKLAQQRIAQLLWSDCSPGSPRSTSLIVTGVLFRSARPLIWRAPFLALLRAAVWVGMNPLRLLDQSRLLAKKKTQLEFLVSAPMTKALVAEFDS